jgi:hypothetical protein
MGGTLGLCPILWATMVLRSKVFSQEASLQQATIYRSNSSLWQTTLTSVVGPMFPRRCIFVQCLAVSRYVTHLSTM